MHFSCSGFLMNTSVAFLNKLEVFDGITDPRLVTVSTRLAKSSVEKLSRRPHKRSSLKIFLIARLFTDKQNAGGLRPFTKNGARCVMTKIAERTVNS
ncbi:hypothetical protein AA0228_2281 [Gluconobacter frateurii NRIC 0228]|uniref:Transposase n=1 Tax=Gluconobacter frateurii NRIC 0228 TaxID=1307946 RepID=A0ABQ0QDH3_9PROT|nr:hypothetical protein AA0228_2281 [Gluconobacter frateurii NRIC 0228]